MKQAALIHELYWLCEELLSYTDLTGERFDIDSANRRLWSMHPILNQLQNDELVHMYQTLLEDLENTVYFDKPAFTTKVHALFNKVEQLRD